ncbi:uncharacterized protein METZ01_LOCUS337890, partial [marine metagenome]
MNPLVFRKALTVRSGARDRDQTGDLFLGKEPL